MIDELQGRLAQLQQEYRTGEARLHDLVRQETVLRETLLRISGAVQVLQEVLESAAVGSSGSAPVSESGSGPTSGSRPEERAANGVAVSTPHVLTVP